MVLPLLLSHVKRDKARWSAFKKAFYSFYWEQLDGF